MALPRPHAGVRPDAVCLLHPVPVGALADGDHPWQPRPLRGDAARPDRHVARLRQSDRQPRHRSRRLRPRLHDAVLSQLLRGLSDRTGEGGAGRRCQLLPDLPPHHAAELAADHRRHRHLPVHQHLERLPVCLGLCRHGRFHADDGGAEQRRQHLHRCRRIQRQHGGGDDRSASDPPSSRHNICLPRTVVPSLGRRIFVAAQRSRSDPGHSTKYSCNPLRFPSSRRTRTLSRRGSRPGCCARSRRRRRPPRC